jgi:hypothetical protein
LEKLNWLPTGDPNNAAANWDPDPSDEVFINSHGSESTVNHLKAEDVAKRIARESELLKKKPHSTIVLNACNTGKGDNSIAQKISKYLHTTVIAPDQYVWGAGPIDAGTWGESNGHIDLTHPGHWRVFKDGVFVGTIPDESSGDFPDL